MFPWYLLGVTIGGLSFLDANSSFSPWNWISRRQPAAHQNKPRSEPQPGDRERIKSERPHHYDTAEFRVYDQPSVRSRAERQSPHYEVNLSHTYEFQAEVDCAPHYKMAGNASWYEVPVTPYETPTINTKVHKYIHTYIPACTNNSLYLRL